MKVYLLWGEQGAYSDKSSWVHSVYAEAGNAERACADLQAAVSAKINERSEAYDWSTEQELTEEVKKLDPRVSEYCYEPPSYSIEEKELIV